MSAMQKLNNAQREALIHQAFDRMCATTSMHDRQTAWDAMRELVKGRSEVQKGETKREKF